MRLPSIIVLAPPKRLGVTNAPKEGIKTSKEAAIIPFLVKGRRMRQITHQSLAPKS
jgi:hypothetical protein